MDVNLFVSSRRVNWYMTWPAQVKVDLDLDLRSNITLPLVVIKHVVGCFLTGRTRWYSTCFLHPQRKKLHAKNYFCKTVVFYDASNFSHYTSGQIWRPMLLELVVGYLLFFFLSSYTCFQDLAYFLQIKSCGKTLLFNPCWLQFWPDKNDPGTFCRPRHSLFMAS